MGTHFLKKDSVVCFVYDLSFCCEKICFLFMIYDLFYDGFVILFSCYRGFCYGHVIVVLKLGSDELRNFIGAAKMRSLVSTAQRAGNLFRCSDVTSDLTSHWND